MHRVHKLHTCSWSEFVKYKIIYKKQNRNLKQKKLHKNMIHLTIDNVYCISNPYLTIYYYLAKGACVVAFIIFYPKI